MKLFLSKNYRYIIVSIAILLFLFITNLPVPQGLSAGGLKALAIFTICIIFWVTNVLPLMITSILAVILFPLTGVLDASKSYSLFGNQAVFFILGAFILASALIRSGLSKRIVLVVLKNFGDTPKKLRLSILLFSAFMSLWISEHAVAAMMFPIMVELTTVLKLRPSDSSYGKSLFLAMAWGCIIGGITTFLGGARAPLALGILKETTNQSISFIQWSLAALPTVICLLVIAFFILDKLYIPEIKDITIAKETLTNDIRQIGKFSKKEKKIGFLLISTIYFWIVYGEKYGLANIALAAVVIAFLFKLMKWREVEEDVNWGIFLMYGGAICLGFAMQTTGAASWLAKNTIGLVVTSPRFLVLLLPVVSMLLTEAISNSAVIALLMPVALGLGKQFAIDPKTITLAVTIPSGLAFIFPMATPAIALAYSSGFLKLKDTIVSGLILIICSWLLFNLFATFYWPLIGFTI